jgi:hypothetical protein
MSQKIFLSHYNKDKALAEVIASTISRITVKRIDVWFSSDLAPSGGLQPGAVWFDEIKKRLEQSKAIVPLLTPASMYRPWIYYESGFGAAKHNCEVIPVCIGIKDLAQVPLPLSLYQCYILRDLDSMTDFIRKLLNKYKIPYDKEMMEPFLVQAVESITELAPRNAEQSCEQAFIEKHKVKSFRWDRLSREEKKQLYEAFLNLNPQHHKPRSAAVPIERQYELNHLNPIDLRPLINLLNLFGLSADNIKLPLTEYEYATIHDTDIEYAQRISDRVELGLSSEQKEAISDSYTYLSGLDLAADDQAKRECDVVIVPGARKGMPYRVDEAYKVCAQSNALVILSGNHPSYDINQELQIGEAEAMDYYLRYIKGLSDIEVEIILESRARNSRETSIHILPDLQRLYFDKGRPLNIILATSPYHMRRFYFLINKGLQDYKHIVNSIKGVTSTASFDLRMLYDVTEPAGKRRRYGMGVYIQEFFKIIGARVTGEL